MSVISVQNLSAGYGAKDIISGVTASAKPGELIALIGPNGSGKSTLIKTLAGLLPSRSGEIMIGQTPLQDLDLLSRARTIAYLAQDRLAQPDMKVAEIIELGRAPYRGRLGKISPDGQDAIERAIQTAQLTPYLTRAFGELSGGEQARVLLGRALAVDAPIVLADEPIAALDPYYQISTMEILKAQAASGKIVIAALHDLSLAYNFADQLWVMDQGQLTTARKPGTAAFAGIIEDVFGVSPPAGGFEAMKILQSKN